MSKNVTLIQKKLITKKVSCVALVATNLFKTLDAYCLCGSICIHSSKSVWACTQACARVCEHFWWLNVNVCVYDQLTIITLPSQFLCVFARVCVVQRKKTNVFVCVCVFACACTCEHIFVLRFENIVIENSEKKTHIYKPMAGLWDTKTDGYWTNPLKEMRTVRLVQKRPNWRNTYLLY